MNVVYSVAALALGIAGMKVPALRKFCSYGSAILVLLYVCSLSGILLLGRIPAKGYLAPGIGFLLGAAIGIALGIPAGRVAVHNNVVYWVFVLLVAGVIAWLKPLV